MGRSKNNKPIDVEVIPELESRWIAEIAAITVKLQDKRKSIQNDQVLRGVHPKSHGCVDAEFIVNKDIGRDHRVGLFAHPGKRYRAKIRYSNAAVLVRPDLDDGKNGSRGMAIKVFDVKGPGLLRDGRARNQDFLMVNTAEFAFGNVRDYLRLSRTLMTDEVGAKADLYFLPLKLLQMGLLDPAGTLKPPAPGEPAEVAQLRQIFERSGIFEGFTPADLAGTAQSLKVVEKIQQKTVRNPLEVTYFSAAPFRFGPDRVMKFSVAPVAGEVPQQDFSEEELRSLDDDYLAQAVRKSVGQGRDICLSFKVQVVSAAQLAGREAEMIENAAIGWNEQEFPSVEVAQLVIRPVGGKKRLVDACKSRRFTPWHALAAHEPLGGINRLRRPVYRKSAVHRRNVRNPGRRSAPGHRNRRAAREDD